MTLRRGESCQASWAVSYTHLLNYGAVANDGAECFVKGVGDAIHAADGLEHGGLPVNDFFCEHALPQIGVEEGVHGEGVDGLGHFFARARRNLEARALGAFKE